MEKNQKNATAIAKPMTNQHKEDDKMEFHNNCSIKPKAKFTTRVKNKVQDIRSAFASSETVKLMSSTIPDMIGNLAEFLGRAVRRGLIFGIILHIIATYFWPELPETIPIVYEFFNGFLVVTEFLFKVALGGLASIFNGTFHEFGGDMMSELGELWQTFCTWVSAIGF